MYCSSYSHWAFNILDWKTVNIYTEGFIFIQTLAYLCWTFAKCHRLYNLDVQVFFYQYLRLKKLISLGDLSTFIWKQYQNPLTRISGIENGSIAAHKEV